MKRALTPFTVLILARQNDNRVRFKRGIEFTYQALALVVDKINVLGFASLHDDQTRFGVIGCMNLALFDDVN
jgi:hypothetical protein